MRLLEINLSRMEFLPGRARPRLEPGARPRPERVPARWRRKCEGVAMSPFRQRSGEGNRGTTSGRCEKRRPWKKKIGVKPIADALLLLVCELANEPPTYALRYNLKLWLCMFSFYQKSKLV
jgi:hypothetical protein